jgi:hypothetical protein
MTLSRLVDQFGLLIEPRPQWAKSPEHYARAFSTFGRLRFERALLAAASGFVNVLTLDFGFEVTRFLGA